jgi:hypothetical protein
VVDVNILTYSIYIEEHIIISIKLPQMAILPQKKLIFKLLSKRLSGLANSATIDNKSHKISISHHYKPLIET